MIKNIPSSGGVVYGLFDPITSELRYIGVTRNALSKRLWAHVKDAKSGKEGTWKAKWIRKLLAQGKRPEAVVLERWGNDADLLVAERWSIEYYRSIGCNLTNISPGGDSPTFSADVRRAMSARGERCKEIKTVDLAKEHGVSPTTLVKWLSRRNARMRGIAGGMKLRRGVPDDQKRVAISDYVAGNGVDDLALRYGCSQAKIYALLRAAGVVRRTWTKRSTKIRSVVDLETGIEYRYQSDVADALGVSRALVCNGLARGIPVNGHRLRFV